MDSAGVERRLAATMFTDIVGYTALMARDEEAARRARSRHEDVVRPLVERYGGRWVERTGDETLSSFRSALDAVNCALAVQADLDEDPELCLRIGIHQGDVTFDADGVSGDGVNVAARIRPLAEPGAIAISDEVQRSVEGQPQLRFKSLGRRKLRNVRRRLEVYAVSGEAGLAPPTPRVARADPATRSIAVLPLDHLGPPEQGYVADGVTDALIESLARIGPELRVISRTSVMRYKGTALPAREIADELGVEFLIGGTAQRHEDRVLIRVQLIEPRQDTHLWAQSYERDLRDFFSVQREIARAVAGEIEIALKPEREPLLAATRPVDPEALELYLRAVTLRGPSTLVASWGPSALELLERSVALDSRFAEGWVELAATHANLRLAGLGSGSRENWVRAREAARRALELDEQLGAAHAALGTVQLFHDWDFEGARRALERAVELSPSDPYALLGLAQYLLFVGLGKSPAAERLAERLQRVAPLDLFFRTGRMVALLFMREYDRALSEVARIRELDPEFVDGNISFLYFLLGRPEEAMREYLAFLARLGPDFEQAREAFRLGSEEGGWIGGLRAVTKLAIEGSELAPGLSYVLALQLAVTGETEEAMAWLERAYEEREPLLINAKIEPRLDSLRSDPRFDDLLRRIGFPES